MSIPSVDLYSARPIVTPAPVYTGGSVQSKAAVSTVDASQASKSANAPVSQSALEAAVKNINEFVSPMTQSIEFSLDQESGRTIVKVVDSETQKVLRQIPDEEVLQISKTLDKLQGLLIKQTA
ncbi:MAG: flagellar protein FlaG [Methylophilaceae bacterium]|jgi:flagellar protein FlaG|nr:flagellar protein FlaG [Methyloradius sp.]